ncbi:putative conserved integral membrane protein [Actinokineospora spheciospongiae]|uniref:Putative conserved integral membrane protein n=1 Tax=Actinokineospora spheciospongiae TaxID=909613 RepID=W7J0S3_9PSEU|nr:glycosyltransferase 87 family protein [Actinokineospora spheciospongiae]EWC59714.1 putative conserved integral membrane protein [Actinokineospora spheciospongiae]
MSDAVGAAPRPVKAGVVAGVAVALGALAVFAWLSGRGLGVDSSVYRAGALTFLNGDALYAPLTTGEPWAPALPFTYPPIAAILFVPLTYLPAQLAWGLLAVLSVLSLAALVRLSLPRASANWQVLLVFAGAFALEPVWRTLALGQVNLVLAALVAVDVLVLRGRPAGGVLIGLAAAVKLTPLIFVAHLALTGRWADAGRAAGTFVLLNLAAWALLPGDTGAFWGQALLDGNDATTNSWIGNQSINGLVQRLTGEGHWAMAAWAVAGALCLAVGALVVTRLAKRGDQVGALLVTAFAGLLVSPVSWTHHWVWVVPLVGWLIGRGRPLWVVAVAVVATGWEFALAPSGAKVELRWSGWQAVLGNAYVAVGLALVPVVAALAVRGRARRAEVLADTG